jgi:hypothetical protein
MNQSQRDYWCTRIKEVTSHEITKRKALYASQIEEIADSKFNEFLESLNIKADLDALRANEQTWRGLKGKLLGMCDNLKETHPDSKSINYYGSDPSVSKKVEEYLKECCRYIAKDEFYKTEAGREIKSLENTQNQAIDTVMLDGCKVDELQDKLNTLLSNAGIGLLTVGVQ